MNNDALKEIEIYFVPLSKMGIPNKLFYGFGFLMIAFGFMMSFKLAVFFSFLFFPTLQQLHKNDMNAYKIFIQFISSKTIGYDPLVKNFINYKIG